MSLPMQNARYRARAIGAAQFAPSKNGNMQIAVPFRVLDDGFSGATITWFATLHDTPDRKGKTGKDRVIESLIYMGFQGDDITTLMEISDAEAQALLPDEVEIDVEPEEYEGEDRLRVKWVNRAGGGRAGFKEPVSKDGMRAFAAQMRNSLKNARGGMRAAGAAPSRSTSTAGSNNGQLSQQPHPNAPGGANDDIPF